MSTIAYDHPCIQEGHHWVSFHQEDLPIPWIEVCSQCSRINAGQLRKFIDGIPDHTETIDRARLIRIMQQSMFKRERNEDGIYEATIYPAHTWVDRVIEYINSLGYQEPEIQHLWKSTDPATNWCGDEAIMNSPLTEPERMARPVCAKCHQQAMHWRADEQAKAEANLKVFYDKLDELITPRHISSYNIEPPMQRMTKLQVYGAFQEIRENQKND